VTDFTLSHCLQIRALHRTVTGIKGKVNAIKLTYLSQPNTLCSYVQF